MVKTSYSASRSFDASKYIYNQTVGQASEVSTFMSKSLDAAKNAIVGAKNQSVMINGAGIQVGGDSKYKLRIIDSMIAMTDDDWKTAKLAIGRFASPEIGEYFGINADVIGGSLLIGNNLILENPQMDENNRPTGIMQFKIDSTGAWLNNSTFVLQKDNGGKIILDPRYGIAAGNGSLFTTSGTTVKPSFVDKGQKIITDSDGMPINTNFFLDIVSGSAYFRGKVYTESGFFSGELKAATGTFSGDISGASGTFKGTVQASRFLDDEGHDMMNGLGQFTSDYLDVRGLNVNDNFIVDEDGNLTINGNINFSGGSITWGGNKPASGISAREASTLITEKLVSSPNIAGGKFWNLDQNTWIEIAENHNGNGGWGLTLKNTSNWSDTPIWGVYDGDFSFVSLSAKGYDFMTFEAGINTAYPYGIWDFSNATVKGLTFA